MARCFRPVVSIQNYFQKYHTCGDPLKLFLFSKSVSFSFDSFEMRIHFQNLFPLAWTITGESLSEVLIYSSINPQYDNRLFNALRVQYEKITRAQHVKNMSRTCGLHKLFRCHPQKSIKLHNFWMIMSEITWIFYSNLKYIQGEVNRLYKCHHSSMQFSNISRQMMIFK